MISKEDFSALEQDDQVNRLRQLGERAMAEFGITPLEVMPLVHGENTTFRVETPTGRFCLRISRPGYQTSANIRSEIEFLADLRAAEFRVPAPYQARLVTAECEVVPEPRDCVLFHWMDGEFRREVLSISELRQVAQLMARLHDFSTAWNPPANFERNRCPASYIHPEIAMELARPTVMARDEDRAALLEVDAEACALLPQLPRTPDWYGIAHTDLHRGNVLFDTDDINLIDFDDTAYAFWLNDFAAALSELPGQPHYREAVDAFLESYSAIRPLPPRTEELLPAFLRFRLASVAHWIIQRVDNPRFRAIGPDYVADLIKSIRAVG